MALPSGYIANNITRSTAAGMDVQVLVSEASAHIMDEESQFAIAIVGDCTLYSTYWWQIDEVTGHWYCTLRIYVIVGGVAHKIYEYIHYTEQHEYEPPIYLDDYWSAVYHYSKSAGPFQMGVQFSRQNEPSQYPAYALSTVCLRYCWFYEPGTETTQSLGGYTHTDTSNQTYSAGASIGGVNWGPCSYYAGKGDPGGRTSRYNNVELDIGGECYDAVDEGDPDWPRTLWASNFAYPLTKMTYDLEIRKYGGATYPLKVTDSAVCLFISNPNDPNISRLPYYAYLQTPYNAVVDFKNYSWPCQWKGPGIAYDGIDFLILSTECANAVPPLSTRDRQIPIRGVPATYDPTIYSIEGYYKPISLAIANSISVHRPDGEKRSDYVSADTDSITVIEGATDTTFIVKEPDGIVSRVQSTIWERYFDGEDPLFSYTACAILKHRSDLDEDIWWWGTYSYLKMLWTCPVACTVTMQLDWRHVRVFDPHSTGEAQEAWYAEFIPEAWQYTFDLEAKPNEQQEITVDLLFPNNTVDPVYTGRIDKIAFYGLVPMDNGDVATVVLNGMGLQSSGSPYYPKVAMPIPTIRDQYSMITLAHDGAWAFGHIPDDVYKPNQGAITLGGSPRHTDPLTGGESGIVFDTMKSLSAVWAEANLVEGVTATYDHLKFLEANSDGNNTISEEPVDFIQHYFPPEAGRSHETPWEPQCAITTFKYSPVNCAHMYLMAHYDVWASIEVLCHAPNGTRASGVSLVGSWINNDGDKIQTASAITDAHGYAMVAPLPAGDPDDDITSIVEEAEL